MTQIYYGDGNCTIEGSDIVGVEISYSGDVSVIDKTPDGFILMNKNNKILIFPLPIHNNRLNDLFDYSGNLKIISALVVDNTNTIIPVGIKRVMDYAELITSTAETMTTKSEDLKVGYASRTASKKPLKQSIVANLNTATDGALLYLSDGTRYEGMFHLHLNSSAAMTGAEHTQDSQDLFYKQYLQGKLIDRLVPTRNPKNDIPAKNVWAKMMKRARKKQ